MPEWNGYRDNESDVGDGWDSIENCSLYIKGEARRRLGFNGKVNLGGYIVNSGAELGSYSLFGTNGGYIWSLTQGSDTPTQITTGMSTTKRPTWAMANGRLYYTNGTQIRVSDSGTSIRTVGITAPASAATATPTGSGGVVTGGAHLFRYRYYDSSRNRLSNASTAVTATVMVGQTVTVGYAASGDPTVDKIIIEATAVGAETYYRAATITNSGSTYSFNIADATLIVGVAASRDGETGHEPPPAYDIIAEHRQRLWQWKQSTGVLLWSRALFPESWDQINYNRVITLGPGDTPTAMFSFYSDLYLVGKTSMRRLVYTSDPAAAMIVDVPGNLGCFNAHCMLKIDGVVFGWGKNGAWLINAMQPKKISSEIDSALQDIASTTTTNYFIAYEPIRREIMFFFPVAGSGSSYCTAAFVYGLDNRQWVLYKYRQAISWAHQHSQYPDRTRLAIFDENGWGWHVGAGTNDGGNDGVMTVTSGSSTTVINGTNSANIGQILYNPVTGEERRITAQSSSQVTLASALATAPTAGMKMHIGSIRQRLLTDWMAPGGINAKKRPTKFLIAVRPEGDMGEATVNYYQDFGATAIDATAFASDTFPEGVSIADGTITVDMDAGAQDGLVPVPTPADWKRIIRAEIIAEEPLDGIRFLDASFKDDKEMLEDSE